MIFLHINKTIELGTDYMTPMICLHINTTTEFVIDAMTDCDLASC